MSSFSEIVGTGMMRGERDAGSSNVGCPHDVTPMFARYIYAGLFLIANILGWLVREEHVKFFEGQRRSGCQGHRDCLAADAVLITSHTSFLFFVVMFFSTVHTRKLQDCRNSLHSQWWPAKIVLLLGCIAISTFAPTYWIQFYGEAAPFGAGIFLFIQLLSVMRIITRLNENWCESNFETRWLLVIAVSTITYVGSTVAIVLMSLWYTGCRLNVIFIGTTLLLLCIMSLIAMIMRFKATGFYREPGLVGAYCVFLCFSGIRSEPETNCYKKEKAGADWKTLMFFVIELISTAASAFSISEEYKYIQLTNVAESEDDVPYGYGFFHFVFAMGSMYFGMLFVGWDTHHIMEKFSVDVGWTSAWVHIGNEGLAVVSFVAILVARKYGIGWLRQMLARIFGIGGQQQQQQPSEMNIIVLASGSNDDDAGRRRRAPPSPSTESTEEDLDDTIENWPPALYLQTTDQEIPVPPTINAAHPPPDQQRRRSTAPALLIPAPPPPPISDDDAAAGSSRPPATAGRRHNWTRPRLRLPTRKAMLYCLCLHLVFICFASLYMMYILTDPSSE